MAFSDDKPATDSFHISSDTALENDKMIQEYMDASIETRRNRISRIVENWNPYDQLT